MSRRWNCEHRNAAGTGSCFNQDILSLAVKIGRHQADAGDIAAGLG